MQTATRPLPVTLIGCLYIVVGIAGAAVHLVNQRGFASDLLLAVLVNLAALIGGVWMLRQQNWARWLAIAWMAFHVILSIFHSPGELMMHALFLAVIAFFLFRPRANAYFRLAASGS
jgi:small basic protein